MIETESRMVVARGWGEGEGGVFVSWVQSFSLGRWTSSGNGWWGWWHNNVNVCNILNCTLKNEKLHIMYISPQWKERCGHKRMRINKLTSCIIKKWGESFLLPKVVVNLEWDNVMSSAYLIQGLACSKSSAEGGTTWVLLPIHGNRSHSGLSGVEGGVVIHQVLSGTAQTWSDQRCLYSLGCIQTVQGPPPPALVLQLLLEEVVSHPVGVSLLPALCQRKHSTRTTFSSPSRPWGRWECYPATQRRIGEGKPRPGDPTATRLLTWLLESSHQPCWSWAAGFFVFFLITFLLEYNCFTTVLVSAV